MIRWNPKTGRWSDELPSRLCSFLSSPLLGGGPRAVAPATITRIGSAAPVSSTTVTLSSMPAVPVGSVLAATFGSNGHGSCSISAVTGITWTKSLELLAGFNGTAPPGSWTANRSITQFTGKVTTALTAGWSVTGTFNTSQTSGNAILDRLDGCDPTTWLDSNGTQGVNGTGNITCSLVSNTTVADTINLVVIRDNNIAATDPLWTQLGVSNWLQSLYRVASGIGTFPYDGQRTESSYAIVEQAFRRQYL